MPKQRNAPHAKKYDVGPCPNVDDITAFSWQVLRHLAWREVDSDTLYQDARRLIHYTVTRCTASTSHNVWGHAMRLLDTVGAIDRLGCLECPKVQTGLRRGLEDCAVAFVARAKDKE
jgi:hypothetical protein